jgi:transcription-repair coupling factor (superfamily II helicase)
MNRSSDISTLTELPALVGELAGLPSGLAGWRPGIEYTVGGVRDAVRALLAASLLHQQHTRSLLVLLPETADADIVATDLTAFGFPDTAVLPLSGGTDDPESLRDHDFAARLRVLQKLRYTRSHSPTSTPFIVCASVAAAIQSVPSIASIERATRRFEVGQRVDLDELQKWLVESGFHGTTAVQFAGEFCLRGGIFDVFAVDQTEPLRIEFFDDEIESIRQFDPASQRSTQQLQTIELSAIGSRMHDEGRLADYLAADAVVMICDPRQCQQTSQALRQRVSDPQRFLAWEDLLLSFRQHHLLFATDLPEVDGEHVIRLPTFTVDSFTGELDQIRSRVDTVAAGHRVIVVADTPADAERMSELLRETAAATHGRLSIAVADLSGGFRISAAEQSGVLVLTGAELFHRSPVRRARARAKSKPIDSFHQLEAGDLVVHLSHGIGLYRGIRSIEKNGQQQEHLMIEFDGATKVYVPAHRISLIQRYVGGSSSRPRLAKLGGQSWAKNRRAAELAVHDMAADLLEIQASRRTRSGISFDADSQWQHQFDASFPYSETNDQLVAIETIKNDMETPRPMDRLICGDVGFGKTEVAMRAAFKAVDSGYQVAVLVPTTVLAEQHYHTFCQRMAEFPFDIGRLNRFVDPKTERDTIKRLEKGQIDIAIGTHRLAGKDVNFFNLGLVIIDEEHRFGVAIKERLKAKHKNVDVLTLSATPIPRTLHMALVGVRDISNLETPPAERLSVETHVTRWDETLIRRTMIRELNRGGQIYFVHNRIADIVSVAEKLQRIVPEARIGIGHGQMDESDLERVMIEFIDRKHDILLATTIIESGLDIPNANTIYIDEAHRYGLADLHQLRGRVGRYKHQAYCYLLIDRNQHLTPEASKRLRAIEEFSQMGAGFAISMRDLEIRGAGNLLGTQQSGHIAAIGYELYCQLLEDAVRQAQHLPPLISAEVDIDLPIAASLPAEYVPDMRHKIDLYRRIAKLDSYPQIDEMRAELLDRFGSPPRPVERLLEVAELRLDAAIWQIGSLAAEREFMVLRYSNRTAIEKVKRSTKIPVRIVDDNRAYVPVNEEIQQVAGGDGWLELAKSVLRPD